MAVSAFHLVGPMTSGTMSLSTRHGLANVPCVIRRPRHLGPVTGGVVFSKLSKLLNQEDALSAPCLRGEFCSPQASSRSAGILRKGLISHFRCHITVCDYRVIILTSADAFPVVGGRCTGRARRCTAKQGQSWHDGPDM
jgi:hypothetical protein